MLKCSGPFPWVCAFERSTFYIVNLLLEEFLVHFVCTLQFLQTKSNVFVYVLLMFLDFLTFKLPRNGHACSDEKYLAHIQKNTFF